MAGNTQESMFPVDPTTPVSFLFVQDIRREDYRKMSSTAEKGNEGVAKVKALLKPTYWVWVGVEANVPHDLCVQPRGMKEHRDITLSLEVRTREDRDKAIPRLGEQDCPVIAVYSYVEDLVDFCVARGSGLFARLVESGKRPQWKNAFALDDIWLCWMESLTQKTVTTLGKPTNGTGRPRI